MTTTALLTFTSKLTAQFDSSDLIIAQVEGSEAISELFQYTCHINCSKKVPDLKKLVGSSATISIKAGADSSDERYLNGYVTEVKHCNAQFEWDKYELVVRPWFWLLTKTNDCKIFSGDIKEIIDTFFREQKLFDYEFKTTGASTKLDYCTQYKESDFDFISRLLEEEGYYYYFEHDAESHKMVICNANSAHHFAPNCESLDFNTYQRNDNTTSVMSEWSSRKDLQQPIYSLNDYDYEKPNSKLLVNKQLDPNQFIKKIPQIEKGSFTYPGNYASFNTGESKAKILAEHAAQLSNRIIAKTSLRGLYPGGKIGISNSPEGKEKKEFLVVRHEFSIENVRAEDHTHHNSESKIELLDHTIQYRHHSNYEKPLIHGSQTAIVVGKTDQETYINKGRVKVQFHWDRHSKANEENQGWVRVAQAVAGKGWGSFYIPRVGDEVVVNFLNGDPDQPIITGAVYNGSHKNPFTTDNEDTTAVSGFRSRTTNGGGKDNCNEISFTDKKGSECLTIKAEKDQVIEVKGDLTRAIKGMVTETIDKSHTLEITDATKITIDKDRISKIPGMDETTVEGDITLTAKGNITLQSGQAKIVLKSDGSVEISGKSVDIN